MGALDSKWIRVAAYGAFAAAAVIAQIVALRMSWPVDTQNAKLRQLEIRSGYELQLDSSGEQPDETILSYEGTSEHDHPVTLKMANARLSPESLAILKTLHPPQTAGPLTLTPEFAEKAENALTGEGCQTNFNVAFSKVKNPRDRSVLLFPPLPTEYTRPDSMRTIKLQSVSDLVVHISANAPHGRPGPGCRRMLQLGGWSAHVGRDLELAFMAEPNSPVSFTLAPDLKGEGRWHSGANELEALMIQPMQPQRLFVIPQGVARPVKSLVRVGPPFLTVTGLRMGGDFFDVDLLGLAGVPIGPALGPWKWPLLAAINGALFFVILRAVWRLLHQRPSYSQAESEADGGPPTPSGKLRIFLSYSWADKERVEQIHDLLQSVGADPWIDRENIRGGSEWELSIKEQMRASQRVVIFVSCASVHKAGFAWAEMRLAARIAEEQPEGADFIIPVKLDSCRLPDLLSRWHCIDLFEPQGTAKLLDALGLRQPDQTGQAKTQTSAAVNGS